MNQLKAKQDINVDLEISKAHLTGSGWHLDNHYTNNPFETHCFYVMDLRGPEATPILITVPIETFDQVKVDHIPEAYASLVTHIASQDLNEELIKKLAGGLCHYLKSTQTYKIWKHQPKQTDRISAIFNIYDSKRKKENGVLRPVIFQPKGSLISPEDVLKISHTVALQDMKSPSFSDCRFKGF